MLKTTHTEHGFARVDFTDEYGESCSIQKSSLATEDAIWFGVDKVKPKILSRDAAAMGRMDLLDAGPERFNGWVDWPIPKDVSLACRMHLTRAQVLELLPILQHFAREGELP